MTENNGHQPIKLDIRTLKLRELRDVETAVGHKIAAEIATFDFGMDTLQGLMWIALRRIQPEATFDDAGDLDFETIISGLAGPEEIPPSPTPPLDSDGSKPNTSGGNGSTARQPSGEPEPSSATSTQ